MAELKHRCWKGNFYQNEGDPFKQVVPIMAIFDLVYDFLSPYRATNHVRRRFRYILKILNSNVLLAGLPLSV